MEVVSTRDFTMLGQSGTTCFSSLGRLHVYCLAIRFWCFTPGVDHPSMVGSVVCTTLRVKRAVMGLAPGQVEDCTPTTNISVKRHLDLFQN